MHCKYTSHLAGDSLRRLVGAVLSSRFNIDTCFSRRCCPTVAAHVLAQPCNLWHWTSRCTNTPAIWLETLPGDSFGGSCHDDSSRRLFRAFWSSRTTSTPATWLETLSGGVVFTFLYTYIPAATVAVHILAQVCNLWHLTSCCTSTPAISLETLPGGSFREVLS